MSSTRSGDGSRIQALQAIVVALITAVSSIVGTLIATQSSRSPAVVDPPGLLKAAEETTAPNIYIASAEPTRPISREVCKQRVLAAIAERGGTVIASEESWVAAAWRGYGIMVLCRDEVHGASVTVAGADIKGNQDLAWALRAGIFR